MFPVRSFVITPSYRPTGLADEAVATTEERGKQLAKTIKEEAIKAAAFQMGIQIGLYFVPIVGQAIAAVLTLIQYFSGKYYTKQIKNLIEDTVAQIKARGDQSEQVVSAAANRVYDQEYQAAAALALSNQPLGDFWSKIGHAVDRATDSKVVKVATKVAGFVPSLAVQAGRVGTSAILKGVAQVADKTGHDNFASKVTKFEKKGDSYAKQIQSYTNPRDATFALFGRAPLLAAQEKTDALKATAFQEIAAGEKKAIDALQSPEGRAEVRKQTAKSIRGNPDLTLKAQLDLEEAQLRNSASNQNAQLNQAITSMEASAGQAVQVAQQTNNTKVAVGTGLAVVAAFIALR